MHWNCLDDAIRHFATSKPDDWAYVEPSGRMSWAAYDSNISLLAAALVDAGVEPGEHVGVWIPDGAVVHVAMSACLRAGLVMVGIGARSGERELQHLLSKAEVTTLLTVPQVGTVDSREIFDRLSPGLPRLRRYVSAYDTLAQPDGPVTSAGDPARVQDAARRVAGLRAPADRLSLINSTSGTTGLPKCVAHDEKRWLKYHEYAVDCGGLVPGDIFMSVVPAPFGFGLWSAHFTPNLLGCTTVVLPRFDTQACLTMLQQERVSVFVAVSTQFVMLLGQPGFDEFDLSALRVMFTGGEAVPYHKAEEFEERTRSTVVNMYGSNETGVQSYTVLDDPREKRLATGGRIIPEVSVRLFDADGGELKFDDGPGRPASIGTVRSLGYYNDQEANAELYTPDGWMLMGDLVSIDDEGYLTVVGRTSDFIIRGGKNISAAAVEQEVATMPGVVQCAAVAAPDEVFGERVCIYVVAAPEALITIDALRAHLSARGVSKEWFPEYLVLADDLPVAGGGKLSKAELREDVRRRASDLRLTP